jgi:p-cumate 2,3-dioxygenase subunit alpha
MTQASSMTMATTLDALGVSSLIEEDRAARRFRVHRSVFTSPEIFELEMRTFWDRSWLYLGHESELRTPGDFVVRTLAGRSLIFCRDDQGALHAFLNSCPHRGTTVCREEGGRTRHFVCFYHAWSFRLDGTLAAVPDAGAYADFDAYRATMSLRSVPRLELYRGFAFVSFDPGSPPLVQSLAGARECLDLVADQSPNGVEVLRGTHLYTSRTNWKLAVENALDGYHFAPTHRTFIEYRKRTGYVSNAQGGWEDLGNGHFLAESVGAYGRAGLSWEPSWGEAERLRIEAVREELRARVGEPRATLIADHSRNVHVFPNLLLFDFAGVSFRVLEPIAPDCTRVRAYEFAPIGEPPDARALRLDHMLSFTGPGGFASPDDIEAQQCAYDGYRITANDPRPGVAWSDISRGMEKEVQGEPTDMYDEGHVRAFWRHWSNALSEHPGGIGS